MQRWPTQLLRPRSFCRNEPLRFWLSLRGDFMIVATELEEEMAELEPLFPQGEMRTTAAPRCPPDRPNIVRGSKRYSPATHLLAPSQQRKLAIIAREIASGRTGPAPIVRVMLV